MNGLQLLDMWIENNSSRAAFAKASDCSTSHLSNVLSGNKDMSLKLARRFSAATNGEISVDQLFREAVA